jgi:hypothetical protein
MPEHGHLHLKAESSEGIEVISGAVQDAILRVEGVMYDSKSHSFTLGLQRFRQEAKKPSRIMSGLRFDSVLSVKSSGIDQTKTDAFLVLLSIEFEEVEAPSGEVILNFAGHGKIKLTVECLDVMLLDQGDPWLTKAVPDHDG